MEENTTLEQAAQPEQAAHTEETNELHALLKRIEENTQRQARYAKLQCLFSIVTAVLFAVVVVGLLYFLPKINGILGQVDTVMNHVEQVSSQLASADIAGVLSDLEDVTNQMAKADLGGIAQDVGSLVQSSQSGVEEAIAKLNSMDFDTLNQAIADLAAVMKPLSDFFGRTR